MEDVREDMCRDAWSISTPQVISTWIQRLPKAGGNDLTATEHTKHGAGAGVRTLHVRSKVFREAPKPTNGDDERWNRIGKH